MKPSETEDASVLTWLLIKKYSLVDLKNCLQNKNKKFQHRKHKVESLSFITGKDKSRGVVEF